MKVSYLGTLSIPIGLECIVATGLERQAELPYNLGKSRAISDLQSVHLYKN